MKMVQAETTWLRDLQALVSNPLPLDQLKDRWFAAIIGDTPSQYAKSPVIWNAGFKALEIEALFVPLDVAPDRLDQVVEHLRQGEKVLGFSVTVPYKNQILSYLDELEPLAARIGAVNTVLRCAPGRLIGTNTDAVGALRALTQEVLPGVAPLVPTLQNKRVLFIGAGGAAQAVACAMWEQMAGGELTLVNRTAETAQNLLKRLGPIRSEKLRTVDESQMEEIAPQVDLVINASTKGQAGFRNLEPYSALAPAHPVVLSALEAKDAALVQEKWFRQSWKDIQENHARSLRFCARLPAPAACFDLVYAPLETVFLRHARWSGHRTANGKGMNIAQALEAFFHKVCRPLLEEKNFYTPAIQQKLVQAMTEVW